MAQTFSYRRALFLIIFGSVFTGIASLFLFSGGWNQYEGYAAGIDSGANNHWAWNDAIGWVDFYPTPPNIVVSDSQLSGYASSSVGEISLDCFSTSIGDRCGFSNYKVYNDGSGNLSGFAWNDAIGWISFCNNRPECPGTGGSHHVYINANQEFEGYAWNDIVGWISFNCITNTPTCPPSVDYRVKTTCVATPSTGWLESGTFDTNVYDGAQINSILWRGSKPAGTAVRFQMAFSSSSVGTWNFQWDAVSTTSPEVDPNISLPIDYTLGANQRYFRYKVHLFSNLAHTATPRVDDVIVNWSR